MLFYIRKFFKSISGLKGINFTSEFAEIAEIIVRVNKEQNVTIFLVEQNAKMALDIGHYGYVMEVGRIVMEDTCEKLSQAADIQEFYLGVKDEGVRGRRRWKQRKTWR